MSKMIHISEIKEKNIGGINIKYQIIRKNVRNIYLRFGEDSVFTITSPTKVSDEYIEDFLYKKRRFIFSRLGEMAKKNEEIDANCVKYLGNVYEIIIRTSEIEERSVKIEEDKFVIETLSSISEEEKSSLIEEWLKKQCEIIFERVNKEVWQNLNDRGYRFPLSTVQVKTMKSRWGSCSWCRGKFSVNTELIHYPLGCIYSVFYHEYMHYKHHDHSGAFYEDLISVFPEYRKWHAKLK